MKGVAKLFEKNVLWLFLLPSLLGMMVFYFVPFIFSLYYTLIDNISSNQFVGLKNFVDTFKNYSFQKAFLNTLWFMALSIPLNMVFSFIIAIMLQKIKRFKSAFSMLFLLPLVVPSGTIVFFWKCVFDTHGLLNKILFSLGFNTYNWLESSWVVGIIVIVFLWKNIGYNMVLFWTGLSFIPNEYYEISIMEGAGIWKRLYNVTLVYLMPTTFMVFLMSIINSFKIFRETFILFGNYPHQSIYMLQHYMNNQFFSVNMQALSSSSYILSGLITILLIVFFRIQKKLSDNFS